jgi:hypothetical protein
MSEYEEVLATADDAPAYKLEPVFTGALTFSGSLNPSNTITFTAQDGMFLKIDFSGETPTVWVDPALPWDAAAKQFWNAVYRMMGKPAPFSD